MGTLRLIRFENGVLGLQGTGDPSRNANFSLYGLDGEGGDPFAFGNTSWEIVEGIPAVEYDPDDSDSFLCAQQEIQDAVDETKRRLAKCVLRTTYLDNGQYEDSEIVEWRDIDDDMLGRRLQSGRVVHVAPIFLGGNANDDFSN